MKKLVFLFALIIIASAANAGFISMTTKADTLLMKGNLSELNVTVSNSGDEPAHDVKISLLLPEGLSSEGVFAGKIDQNSDYSTSFRIASENKKNGEYPFAILVEYKDANRYPFSAVSPNTIIYNAPSSSRVTATLKQATMQDRGSMVMSIRNLDNVSHNVDIMLYLPKELSSLEAKKNATLAAGEARQESFVIDNAGALTGSTYAVFAVLSYENGQYYSHVASSTIRIGAETTETTQKLGEGNSFFDRNVIIIIIGLLVLLLVIYIIYKLKGRKHEKPPEENPEEPQEHNS